VTVGHNPPVPAYCSSRLSSSVAAAVFLCPPVPAYCLLFFATLFFCCCRRVFVSARACLLPTVLRDSLLLLLPPCFYDSLLLLLPPCFYDSLLLLLPPCFYIAKCNKRECCCIWLSGPGFQDLDKRTLGFSTSTDARNKRNYIYDCSYLVAMPFQSCFFFAFRSVSCG
jgi:hypothetical protein